MRQYTEGQHTSHQKLKKCSNSSACIVSVCQQKTLQLERQATQYVCVGRKVAAKGQKRHSIHQRSPPPTWSSRKLSLFPLILSERLACESAAFRAMANTSIAEQPIQYLTKCEIW